VLLECQNIHYSAFLAIKSYKKANFPPLELLNQVCLQFSESSNLYEAISLLTCAVGDSEPSLFRFFHHKISQKSELPSFWASESGISPVKWVIQSTWSYFITYLCFWRLIALVIPPFWPWNQSKKRISLFLSFWIRYISCQVSYPTCGSGPLLHMAGYLSPQGGYKLLV